MSERFSWNPKGNLKKGFSKDGLIDDALALAGAAFYALVPTMLKLDGWPAFAVAFGVPYAAGKLLNVPALCHTVIGIGTMHLLQSKGNGLVQKVFNRPIWGFNTAAATTDSTTTTNQTTVNDLPPLQGVRGGIAETVRAYSPGESMIAPYSLDQISALAQNPGMEGIYTQDGRRLDGLGRIIDIEDYGSTPLAAASRAVDVPMNEQGSPLMQAIARLSAQTDVHEYADPDSADLDYNSVINHYRNAA
jgi:hypothetical protein